MKKAVIIHDEKSLKRKIAIVLRKLGYQVKTYDSASGCPDMQELGCSESCPCCDVLVLNAGHKHIFSVLKNRGCAVPKIMVTGSHDNLLNIAFVDNPFQDKELMKWVEPEPKK